jgi:hypothetical protein
MYKDEINIRNVHYKHIEVITITLFHCMELSLLLNFTTIIPVIGECNTCDSEMWAVILLLSDILHGSEIGVYNV